MGKTHCIILAGGWGSRLAPLTSPEHPKFNIQINGQSLLCQAVQRNRILGSENIRVVSALPVCNAINSCPVCLEPEARGTAFAIDWVVNEWDWSLEDILVFVPADHIIRPTCEYQRVLLAAIEQAKQTDILVLLAIKPRRVDAGFGHFRVDADGKVFDFVEKPTEPRIYAMGEDEARWNSGIFIATVCCFKHLIAQFWDRQERSFDRGVVARAADYGLVMARALPCYWNDIGTFDRLREEICGGHHRGRRSGLIDIREQEGPANYAALS